MLLAQKGFYLKYSGFWQHYLYCFLIWFHCLNLTITVIFFKKISKKLLQWVYCKERQWLISQWSRVLTLYRRYVVPNCGNILVISFSVQLTTPLTCTVLFKRKKKERNGKKCVCRRLGTSCIPLQNNIEGWWHGWILWKDVHGQLKVFLSLFFKNQVT